jgi:hypothetical protein
MKVLGIECVFQFSVELVQNIFHSDKFLAVNTESPVGLFIKYVLFFVLLIRIKMYWQI